MITLLSNPCKNNIHSVLLTFQRQKYNYYY
jgi:hypothetical protein